MDTPAKEATPQKESIHARLKADFIKTGHVTEAVAESLATVALGSLGAFQE